MAEKLSRKQIKHDKFVEDVEMAYGFATSHRKTVLLGIGGVIAAAAAAWGVVVFLGYREANAQTRLGEAIEIMDAVVTPTPAPDAKAPQYKTEAEKIAKAKPILEEVSKTSFTDAADVASLYLARIAANAGDTATARKNLEEFVSDHPKHLLAAGARVSLYEIDLHTGKAKELVATLEKELGAQERSLPVDVLLNLLAQAYEKSGEHDKARDTWRRIVNEFPDSPYAPDAQRGAMG